MNQIVQGFDRRRILNLGAALGGAQALAACATAAPASLAAPMRVGAGYAPVPQLAPVKALVERMFNITVCLRPFRAAGPRLDTEMVGDKLVVHNYGHGGSGWSLSWGSAAIVVKKALERGDRDIAVIGCGALGLTAALTAQRAGARVAIYAKERMPFVRSARATGVWSPDSRVAMAAQAPPGFDALWEQMTRLSWKTYLGYLGMPGDPVSFTDRYALSDLPPGDPGRRRDDPLGFAHYQSRVRDLTPTNEIVPAGMHPFATPYVQRASTLMFNITEFGHLLMTDFLLAGGRIEPMEFHTPADLAALKQKVVINCTGYGARALWKDETVTPVRGQIAWLVPQPEVTYGFGYKDVSVLSRPDGIVVQNTGPSETWGYNDDNETPDRAEAEASIRTIAELYAWPKPAA